MYFLVFFLIALAPAIAYLVHALGHLLVKAQAQNAVKMQVVIHSTQASHIFLCYIIFLTSHSCCSCKGKTNHLLLSRGFPAKMNQLMGV